MPVLDLRGTHGSGKSWIPHQLVHGNEHEVLLKEDKVQGYYIPKFGLGIVGKYTSPCGGCDGIRDPNDVVERIRLYASQYKHVMFEGILSAHTFGRYSKLADELKEYGYHFLFLNTPLRTCIARVVARRRKRGNLKPLDPTHLTRDWGNIYNIIRKKCLKAGYNVTVLDYRDPMPQVLELLQ